jgi:hypothetical protein
MAWSYPLNPAKKMNPYWRYLALNISLRYLVPLFCHQTNNMFPLLIKPVGLDSFNSAASTKFALDFSEKIPNFHNAATNPSKTNTYFSPLAASGARLTASAVSLAGRVHFQKVEVPKELFCSGYHTNSYHNWDHFCHHNTSHPNPTSQTHPQPHDESLNPFELAIAYWLACARPASHFSQALHERATLFSQIPSLVPPSIHPPSPRSLPPPPRPFLNFGAQRPIPFIPHEGTASRSANDHFLSILESLQPNSTIIDATVNWPQLEGIQQIPIHSTNRPRDASPLDRTVHDDVVLSRISTQRQLNPSVLSVTEQILPHLTPDLRTHIIISCTADFGVCMDNHGTRSPMLAPLFTWGQYSKLIDCPSNIISTINPSRSTIDDLVEIYTNSYSDLRFENSEDKMMNSKLIYLSGATTTTIQIPSLPNTTKPSPDGILSGGYNDYSLLSTFYGYSPYHLPPYDQFVNTIQQVQIKSIPTPHPHLFLSSSTPCLVGITIINNFIQNEQQKWHPHQPHQQPLPHPPKILNPPSPKKIHISLPMILDHFRINS